MDSPFTLRSRESVAESMLLVDGEAVRSSLCRGKNGSRILQRTLEQTRALHSRGTDRKHYLKNKLRPVQERNR